MKKVVVINAYGMKNIGDGAICSVAFQLIDKKLNGQGEIHVMFTDRKEDVSKYKTKSKLVNIWSPYGRAIESKGQPLPYHTKALRMIHIIGGSALRLVANRPDAYIKRIKEADLVIGMGGGYIRTKNKYKDYFGLFLTLLPIYVAKYYKKPVIFLPMSFGNFASNAHKKMSYVALSGTTVMCRDKISMEELKKIDENSNTIKTLLVPDLALSFNKAKRSRTQTILKDNYVVMTARKWLDGAKQIKYEKELIKFIEYAWKHHDLKTYFVSMASNSIEDNDHKVARYISQRISDRRIFDVSVARTPIEVQKLLLHAKAAICTRMHSAILANTVNTPFITIAYEYKTVGLMESLGLAEWNLDIKELSFEELKKKFDLLISKQNYLKHIRLLQANNVNNKVSNLVILNELGRFI